MKTNLTNIIKRIIAEEFNDDIKLSDDMRDHHSGQSYMTARAKLKGEQIGYVDYSIFNHKIYIDMVNVTESYRRKGIATKLFDLIKRENPGMQIVPGYSTDSGNKFYNSYKERSLAENLEDEIEPNKLIEISGFDFSMVIAMHGRKATDEKFTTKDKTILNPELRKIRSLYKGTQTTYFGTQLTIALPIKTYVTGYIGYYTLQIHKVKGGLFYIHTQPLSEDGEQWYKIKAPIDILIKRIMAFIFMTQKIK